MKRFLTFLLIAIASYISMVIGKLQEHPFLLYLGVVVGGMLALGLVVWLVKLTAKFIGWAMASVLYLVSGLAVTGLLTWNNVIPSFAGFIIAVVFSTTLSIILIRRLAKWAQKSLLGGELFSFISNYQLKSFIHKDTIIDKDTVITYNIDYKNVVVVLRTLDYSKADASEAAKYAIQEVPIDQPIEAKVKKALNYLANRETLVSNKN